MTDGEQSLPAKIPNEADLPVESSLTKKVHPKEVLSLLGTPEEPGPIDPKALAADHKRALCAWLSGQGWSVRQIAKVLRTRSHYIEKYLQQVRVEAAIHVRTSSVDSIAGGILTRQRMLYNKALKEANEAKKPNERLRAIQIAASIEKDLVETLQRLGIVHREPEKIKIQAAVRAEVSVIRRIVKEAVVMFVPEERRHELAEYLRRELPQS